MLISFSVSNHLSFKEQVTLHMTAVGGPSELPGNVRPVPLNRTSAARPLELLKSAIIYGANASGKTNLLCALRDFAQFVRKSHDMPLEAGTPVKPFLLDKEIRRQPAVFEIELLLSGVRYRYGFSADEQNVHEEWLYIADKGPEKPLFERTMESDGEEPRYAYRFGRSVKRSFKNLTDKVRPNALMLSVGAQFNAPEAVAVATFLSRLFNYPGFDMPLKVPTQTELAFLGTMLQFADIGLDHLELTQRDASDLEAFLARESRGSNEETHDIDRLLRPLVQESLKKAKDEKEIGYVYKDSQGEPVFIPERLQSKGTMQLLRTFLTILRQYRRNALILIDEIEDSLHPLLCEALLKFFHDLPDNGSQLICTTHNTDMLNADVFRRDQVWITEKTPLGASKLYSLAEFKGVRKEAKLGKQYLEGRYGGLPILDSRFLEKIKEALAKPPAGEGDA